MKDKDTCGKQTKARIIYISTSLTRENKIFSNAQGNVYKLSSYMEKALQIIKEKTKGNLLDW